ncbi:MAG: hypothetical protein HWE11_00575 [Gammaproteobacteria bacterium]|nr:hypothetical protein [Gammaproteobacteria bacterium]
MQYSINSLQAISLLLLSLLLCQPVRGDESVAPYQGRVKGTPHSFSMQLGLESSVEMQQTRANIMQALYDVNQRFRYEPYVKYFLAFDDPELTDALLTRIEYDFEAYPNLALEACSSQLDDSVIEPLELAWMIARRFDSQHEHIAERLRDNANSGLSLAAMSIALMFRQGNVELEFARRCSELSEVLIGGALFQALEQNCAQVRESLLLFNIKSTRRRFVRKAVKLSKCLPQTQQTTFLANALQTLTPKQGYIVFSQALDIEEIEDRTARRKIDAWSELLKNLIALKQTAVIYEALPKLRGDLKFLALYALLKGGDRQVLDEWQGYCQINNEKVRQEVNKVLQKFARSCG